MGNIKEFRKLFAAGKALKFGEYFRLFYHKKCLREGYVNETICIMTNTVKSGTASFLGSRLRQWRKTLPLKSYELAKVIKISQGSLSDIENNKSLPSADTIAKLYQYTDINVIWLLTGEGPLNRVKNTSSNDEELSEENKDLSELIQKLVRTYYRGDAEKKAHLKGFLLGADPGE